MTREPSNTHPGFLQSPTGICKPSPTFYPPFLRISKLHLQGHQYTDVASLEEDEPPYEEFYRVPLGTARVVNQPRRAGKRVAAVGTTSCALWRPPPIGRAWSTLVRARPLIMTTRDMFCSFYLYFRSASFGSVF